MAEGSSWSRGSGAEEGARGRGRGHGEAFLAAVERVRGEVGDVTVLGAETRRGGDGARARCRGRGAARRWMPGTGLGVAFWLAEVEQSRVAAPWGRARGRGGGWALYRRDELGFGGWPSILGVCAVGGLCGVNPGGARAGVGAGSACHQASVPWLAVAALQGAGACAA